MAIIAPRNQRLASTTRMGSAPAVTAGPISQVSPETGEGVLTVIMDNSAGTQAKKYIIGDGSAIWAAASGETVVAPSSGTITPSVMNASFAPSPVMVGSITYKVTSSANQFSKKLRKVTGFRNGGSDAKPINVSRNESSADQNTKVRILRFDASNAPILGSNQGLVLEVGAGETVSWDITLLETRN